MSKLITNQTEKIIESIDAGFVSDTSSPAHALCFYFILFGENEDLNFNLGLLQWGKNVYKSSSMVYMSRVSCRYKYAV